MSQHYFPGFSYTAKDISAYIFSIDTFILSLKNQQIINYKSSNPDSFKKWLRENNIRDISEEIGTLVYNHYFKKFQ